MVSRNLKTCFLLLAYKLPRIPVGVLPACHLDFVDSIAIIANYSEIEITPDIASHRLYFYKIDVNL